MNQDGTYKTNDIRNGDYDFEASALSHINKCWYPENEFRAFNPLERRKLMLNQLNADQQRIRNGQPLTAKRQAAQLRVQERREAALQRAEEGQDSYARANYEGTPRRSSVAGSRTMDQKLDLLVQ